MSSPALALNVSDLTLRLAQRTVLNGVSLQVAPGQVVGVIGPNGAGKSSLLRCLYRHPFARGTELSGDIQLNGQPQASFSRRALAQQVAVVLQEPALPFDLPVRDVIAMGLTPVKPLLSLSSRHDRQRLRDVAALVDVREYLSRSFSTLSGGEKQRVLIARALLTDPQLLLLDEPTNHLDIRHQLDVLSLVRQLPVSVVVTLHDLNLAATYCDALLVLDRGDVIASGAPAQVLTPELLARVFGVDAEIDVHEQDGRSVPRLRFMSSQEAP